MTLIRTRYFQDYRYTSRSRDTVLYLQVFNNRCRKRGIQRWPPRTRPESTSIFISRCLLKKQMWPKLHMLTTLKNQEMDKHCKDCHSYSANINFVLKTQTFQSSLARNLDRWVMKGLCLELSNFYWKNKTCNIVLSITPQ